MTKSLQALPFLLLTTVPAWAQLGPVPLAGQAVQAQGATAARPLAQKLSDQLSLKDFGAACDGATDDSNAVRAAGQSGRRVIVPEAVVCNAPSVPQATMQGVFIGGGHIRGSDGNPRGAQFGAVRSPPNPQAWDQANSAQDNCSAGFPCWGKFDYSRTLSAEEYHVSGPATLGQPAHGYEGMPGTNAHTLLIDNSSGWNQSHNSNDGRTGASAYSVVLQHNGGGDFGVFGAQILCNGQVGPGDGNAGGYTDWLAVPACGYQGGNISALAPHQYLQMQEFHINDYGNDVAAIGSAMGYNRTSTTPPALNNHWIHEQVTCNLPGQAAANDIPCDAAYQIGGHWLYGLTFASFPGSTQTTKYPLATMAGQKILLNSYNPDGEGNPAATVAGGDWITDDGANVVLAQNGAPVIRLSNPANAVNAWQFTGAASGGYVNMAPSGPDSTIATVIADKAGGGVSLVSNGNVVLNASNPVANPTAYVHLQAGNAGSPPTLQAYSLQPSDFGLAGAGTGLVRIVGSVPSAGDASTAVATTAVVQAAAKAAVTAMAGNRYKILNVGSGAVIQLPVPAGVINEMVVQIQPNQSTIANMVLTMPPTAAITDGFIVHFIATATITSLSTNASNGQTVLGAPGTISPATPFAFLWDSTLAGWIPFR